MSKRPSPSPSDSRSSRRPCRSALVVVAVLFSGAISQVASSGSEATRPLIPAGLREVSSVDGQVKGACLPAGFEIRSIIPFDSLGEPIAMCFDVAGDLFVAERQPCLSAVETWDALRLPEGGEIRVIRRRRSSADRIKRFRDADRDGSFEVVEVVAEGLDQITGLIRHKDDLLVTASGRLERWSDHDLDGRWETRSVLIDGMGAASGRGLSGLQLGRDGWLYLTSGDDESHPIGRDGNRLDLSHMGSVVRCRVDGSQLQLYCQGLRDPGDSLVFDPADTPMIFDAGLDDGSRFGQGRLIELSEKVDYGWRSLAGPRSTADFDRAAWNGERPGKLAGFAMLSQGRLASLMACNSPSMPDVCQGLIVGADTERRIVRGFKLERDKAATTLAGETILMASLDPQFCPIRILAGWDGNWYLLDRRAAASSTPSEPVTNGSGRIYRITWTGGPRKQPTLAGEKGSASTPTEVLVSNDLTSEDNAKAGRAFCELVARGDAARASLLGAASNRALPTHARVLALQAVRQSWSEDVESAFTNMLVDGDPVIRRLAAQSLAWEPKRSIPRIIPRLVDRLDDPDPKVVREVASAAGRHAFASPRGPAAQMIRWLFSHPTTDPATKDRLIRSLEQLGDIGIGEIDLAVRTRRDQEREAAVDAFVSLRSSQGAESLPGLARLPDLSAGERVKLFRHFRDFPAELAPTTSVLADWALKHLDADPLVKLAALEECRVAGNPASSLILNLLEDDDPDVRMAATSLAGISRPPGSVKLVADTALDLDGSIDERSTAIETLGKAGLEAYPSAEKVFIESDDPRLKKSALWSMASIDRNRALASLISATAGRDPSTRADAIAILGEQKSSSFALAGAFVDRTSTMRDPQAILDILRRWAADREAQNLAAKVVAEAGRRKLGPDPVEVASNAQRHGNPWRGMNLFFRPSSQCASCHQVGGKGGKGGPVLDLDSHQLDASQLTEAIFQPSKSFKNGQGPPRLALAAGSPITTKPVESAPFSGIDRNSIEGGVGGMPEHVAWNFTTGEMTDLIAFLLDREAQAAVSRKPDARNRIAIVGPLPKVTDRLGVSPDRVEPSSAAVKSLFGEAIHWQSLSASPDGVFDLGGYLADVPGRAKMAAILQSPKPQDAWLRLATRHAARIYLNGEKIGETLSRGVSASTDPLASGTVEYFPSMTPVRLKEGKNLLTIAIDGTSGGSDRLAIDLVGPDPLTLTYPKDDPDR